MISFIVPCYNQASYLDEALRAVFAQSYPDWECIIVNDGSLDNTDEIVKPWLTKDKRFSYIKRQHSGVSSARNAGLGLARGAYIQFLDSDDTIAQFKFEKQFAFLVEHPEVSVVYSATRYFVAEKPTDFFSIGVNGQIPTINLDRSDSDQLHNFFWHNPTTICAPLYRAELFKKYGLFDESLRSAEDWDLHFRFAFGKEIFHFEKITGAECFVRLHPTSAMRDIELNNNSYMQFLEKQKRILPLEVINQTYFFLGLPDGYHLPEALITKNSKVKLLFKKVKRILLLVFPSLKIRRY